MPKPSKRTVPSIFACLTFFLAGTSGAQNPDPAAPYDLVIYGDSSGAATAAIAAKREGRSIVWVNPTRFPGGMSASGLGATDFLGRQNTFGGIAKVFYKGVATA